MHTSAVALGVLSVMLCSSTALAARDQRVQKAIDLFDRAEFTRAKDLLVGLIEAPGLSEEDQLQARIYLAASYYGLGDRASAKAQFLALVRRYPRVSLDPGLFLPEVVDLLQEARVEIAKESGAGPPPPSTASAPGTAPKPPVVPAGPFAPPASPARAPALATFLPFGAGQFARGDAALGHAFLWGEVGTLVLAAAAKIHFQYLKVGPSRPWDFSTPAYVENPSYAAAVQNVFAGSLIASGVLAVAGIAEAALRAGGPGQVAVAVAVEPSGGGIAVRF